MALCNNVKQRQYSSRIVLKKGRTASGSKESSCFLQHHGELLVSAYANSTSVSELLPALKQVSSFPLSLQPSTSSLKSLPVNLISVTIFDPPHAAFLRGGKTNSAQSAGVHWDQLSRNRHTQTYSPKEKAETSGGM